MLKTIALAACVALAPAHGQSTAECDRGGLLSPAGIGPLKIGITPDSLARVCRIISRREVPEYSITVFGVRVGSDTIQVNVRGGRVEYFEVRSPVHRTRDSLGVGSAVALLLDQADLGSGVGDGAGTFAIYPQSGALCGLVFWLDGNTADMLAAAKGDHLRLLRMRGGGRITSIDVHGTCKK